MKHAQSEAPGSHPQGHATANEQAGGPQLFVKNSIIPNTRQQQRHLGGAL